MSDKRDPATDQRAPEVNTRPYIQDLVIADMEERKQFGIKKYGTALQAGNGRSFLLDLYEELLDACMYAKGKLEEEREAEAKQIQFEEDYAQPELWRTDAFDGLCDCTDPRPAAVGRKGYVCLTCRRTVGNEKLAHKQ